MGVKNLIRNAKPLKENMLREKSVIKKSLQCIGKRRLNNNNIAVENNNFVAVAVVMLEEIDCFVFELKMSSKGIYCYDSSNGYTSS